MGARVKRKEDPRLITGAGQYTGDMVLPGMGYAVFVRSPYAHARIRSIDVSAALALDGVTAVFTGEDLRHDYTIMPMDQSGEGVDDDEDDEADDTEAEEDEPRSHYPLSIGEVRYAGEPVVLVIANSPAAAEDAAQAVSVEWEPLPVVATLAAALADGAPRVFDNLPDNIARTWTRRHGDPEAAFAAAHRRVSLKLVNQRLAAVPMETRASLAAPDPLTGGLIFWTSTQSAHGIRSQLAKALRRPENQLRVITPEVGGGFGVKIGMYPEDAVVAAAALRLNAPVRWVEGRSEHMLATTHGRAQEAEIEAAVEADGQVTALRVRVYQDVGAYPRSTFLANLTGLMAVGVYHILNVDIVNTSVFTNTTSVAAYRGAGRPEAAYYIERLMDTIAAELDLDPVETRRRNFIPPEAFPHKTATDFDYDSGEYDKALSRALEVSGYAELRAEQQRRLADPAAPLLGIGLSTYVEMCAFGYDGTTVRAEPSGTVTVTTGVSPHGQGTHTSFAQMVSDLLGVPFEHVVVKHGDTAQTPMGQGTMGSRSMAVGGSALWRAAGQVRDKAVRIAAHLLEAAPEDVELREGRYGVKGAPSKGVSFAQIAKRAYTNDLPEGVETGLEATAFFHIDDSTCPFGAHVAVVEVDRETGQVMVRDYFSVDDCGPRVSPMLVEGQVHGGLAQGMAQALWEEVSYDENGQAVTGTLMEYALPRADRLPNFTLDQTVTRSPTNPLGVKGIGEAATIGSTPAIVNAVVDALRPLGVRHIDMPLTPEKVWRAMRAAGGRA
jgi:carbon-monoxide dehydrogenase large subunit